MKVHSDSIPVETRGHSDMIDITDSLRQCLKRSEIRNGTATVFVPGSTGALTTVEYEPGLVEDIPAVLEKIAPYDYPWRHHNTWHDDNGGGHVRASLMGPSITIPIVDGKLTLGTWQQVVLIDCDTRPRSRQLVVQFMGSAE